jgi:hypothetical protein
LVVIAIILLVSAVALPVVLPALAHAQLSEAARMVQGALVGARDSAIHNQLPSGIRLLPDPTLNGINTNPNSALFGLLDPAQPLAFNRIVPIESAPPYSDGMVANLLPVELKALAPPYPCLVVQQWLFDTANTGLPNAPTSWFWNIRVGDKIQINNSGPWYTVVGPMATTPAVGNTEMFVNNVNMTVAGAPPTWTFTSARQGGAAPEFLFLVNGEDDNGNGWIDEGFDGIDNNLNGQIDEPAEWELEQWNQSRVINFQDVPYTIQRRPAPAASAREQALPSNVVIDMTTWGASEERSRLLVNPYTGPSIDVYTGNASPTPASNAIDILIYPNGTVVPSTIYSTPASFGMAAAFFHFWLAERGDVVAPGGAKPPFLPIGTVGQQLGSPALGQARIKGQYRILTLLTRTGQITISDAPEFDNPANPFNGKTYNPSFPFLRAQRGDKGEQ